MAVLDPTAPRIRVVSALIQVDDLYLLVQRQFNGLPGAEDKEFGGMWETPGGKVETGEEDSRALWREIAEELSIGISVGIRLCSIDFNHPVTRTPGGITFVAYHCRLGSSFKCCDVVLKENQAGYGWFTYMEARMLNTTPGTRQLLEAMTPTGPHMQLETA